jgi:protein gp37
VFVDSMSDLFHEDVPDAFIDRVFAVMALAPQHTFQILTKRAERMRAYMNGGWGFRVANELLPAAIGHLGAEVQVVGFAHKLGVLHQPLPNVWLGVSVENRKMRARLYDLQHTPAAVRFASLEPLLEDLELNCSSLAGIDWLIIGGESGGGARPCSVQWIRNIVTVGRLCHKAVFVKQLGSKPYSTYAERGIAMGMDVTGLDPWIAEDMDEYPISGRKGDKLEEMPADLRVREYPQEVAAR